MRKIKLTNALGGAAILCGGLWCLLIVYIGVVSVIGGKSPDQLFLLFLLFPLSAFAVIGGMAINRGRALIKLKTKGNIISTIEVLSVFAGILFVILMTVASSLIFSGIILSYVFFVAFSVLGIIIHVVGCRFVLRKEGFEYTKGELLGKSLASIIAFVFLLASFGHFQHESSNPPRVFDMIVSFIPIFIAYGVYRLCCWGFKRI